MVHQELSCAPMRARQTEYEVVGLGAGASALPWLAPCAHTHSPSAPASSHHQPPLIIGDPCPNPSSLGPAPSRR